MSEEQALKLGEDWVEIILPGGHICLVDLLDYGKLKVLPWRVQRKNGNRLYAIYSPVINGKRKFIYMHSFITGNLMTDHINRNTLDNRRSNLRPCTQSQNQANRGKPKTNTNGFKGIIFRKKLGKWEAHIKCLGKLYYLGMYLTPIEAAKSYDEGAKKLFGEFAGTNF